ncbi:MAG: DNA-processing protein DprA [Pseudonocardiaceae bacterium]
MTITATSKLRRMPPWDDRERTTLVALLQEKLRAASWPGIVAEIIEAGSARSVWDRHHEQSLFDTETPAPIIEAARRIAGWRAAGLGVHTFRDVSYPGQLREIHQVPPVLFSRGTLRPGEPAVSVVGSRRACDHSLDWASELSTALVSAGITVVSGLAAGIDTAAHTAALDAGGRTVAVLGTGINRASPTANRDLQERIADEGLVLSQFWPDAPATKKSFPLRNATMSGYGRVTIVVEAGETSGARIQARVGVEHGRPVILRDRVVEANEWARALQHRPGVDVVSSTDEALGVVAALRPDLDDVLSGVLAVDG